MSLMDFVVSPPGCGRSVTDLWGWDAHKAQLRCPDGVDGDIWIWSSRRGLKHFRTYVGPRPTLWFSYSRRFSWSLTLFDPIFLPPAYSLALIYFGRERGWWITCNYPTVLKEKNMNRKSTTCAICWLKSVLHEEKRRKQENGLERVNTVHLFDTVNWLHWSNKCTERTTLK
jgi:hypothetical protein